MNVGGAEALVLLLVVLALVAGVAVALATYQRGRERR